MDVEMTCVPKVIDPVVAVVIGLTLSEFVVVMWEPEVDASRVNVDWETFED